MLTKRHEGINFMVADAAWTPIVEHNDPYYATVLRHRRSVRLPMRSANGGMRDETADPIQRHATRFAVYL